MQANACVSYLTGLAPEQAQQLARVNAAGLDSLRGYLESGEAVAFLGAGASAPLYPMWSELITELVGTVEYRLSTEQARTCRARAGTNPEEIVEILRQQLGAEFREVLRETFRARPDPVSGRTWTPVHELVCRCAFRGVVTTNYDPGIVDARARVRARATVTGSASYTDEEAMDRWRTGDVFRDGELPVLFAHGHYNQPGNIVLATTEYRHAYTGKLAQVMVRLIDAGHLVWIGFSFADQRIAAILREVMQASGPRAAPGAAPRHIAVMPWDPAAAGNDPVILAAEARSTYGAHVVLYPAPGVDHSALRALLADLADPRFPPVADLPPPVTAAPAAGLPASWTPAAEPVEHFTGRAEELVQLTRWAADPAVRLIGITAWGGAGKTALVTEWIERRAGPVARPGVRGMFAWSFNADASAERWAQALLNWATNQLGHCVPGHRRLGAEVLALLRAVPLVLVLDGLEVVQEGPEGGQFGRLLDGTLREVLTGVCQIKHSGLVVLTSRFAFADLDDFVGLGARMCPVPPFTLAEGVALLAASGGDWLPEAELRELVADVDRHALAVAVLGGVLADQPPTADLAGLRAELAVATSTDARVSRVLKFYADRLDEADRYLVAAVSLFARPVSPAVVLTVARHDAFGGHLDGWDHRRVQGAAMGRLAGLLSWQLDSSTVSAHAVVRDTFRPLALGAAQIAAETTITGIPKGTIATREDGLRVVEAIELLLDANQWQAADELYRHRTSNGHVWLNLPEVHLGQRAAAAFVSTPVRRRACHKNLPRLGWYFRQAGVCATIRGDLMSAVKYLEASTQPYRAVRDTLNLSVSMQNLAECRCYLGEVELARRTAEEAHILVSASEGRHTSNSMATLGWASMLAGDTRAAEEHFIKADCIRFHGDSQGKHMFSMNGVAWGELLARTSRAGPSRTLTDLNREICHSRSWNQSVASCDVLLGRLDLAAGRPVNAKRRVTEAATMFRDGGCLLDLAETLPVLADCARAVGDLDDADRHVEEALSIAGPRKLRLSHTAALAVRARTYADRAAAGNQDHFLQQGRDDAAAAHQIATQYGLAWHELDALEAHARLDQIEGVDRPWAQRVSTLRDRLIPADLDPDPLASVERLAAKNTRSDIQ